MTLKEEIKELLVRELNLEDLAPAEIEDDAPLFGTGLGLDSLDAVELVVLVQKRFGVSIADAEQGQAAFRSVSALAEFIKKSRLAR